MRKIFIFDTTLRDGEQAPGASLNEAQKLEIAHQLQELGVDIIEAGFPISSEGDFRSVYTIARKVCRPVICALARSLKKDIDAAARALAPAKKKRIHVFLATSKIHLKYKFRKAEDEIIRLAKQAVRYARRLCDDVEFSPEDATRTQPEFLYRVVEEVIKQGASTVNIPDTVGWTYPEEFERLIKGILENVPNIGRAKIAVHCHNDLGLAVANSLAAVLAGAKEVHGTINGIGERAGNASLEEIVMNIRTRRDIFSGVFTEINTRQIYKTSKLVSSLTGFLVPPNKAIVGKNAFRHESGIHQDAVIKKRTTYEIMDPREIGIVDSGLVLGKHSGRHALSQRLKELGFNLKKSQIEKVFREFKKLADKKKEVYDDDLVAIVEEDIKPRKKKITLLEVKVLSGTKIEPEAEVKLRYQNKVIVTNSQGDGPVDACFRAVDKVVGFRPRLLQFKLEAVTSGKDALGQARVEIEYKKKTSSGLASSTDIIEASLKAYLEALDKII
ncbi:MAG: 2-isopropylmalate synthase [Candidatus Omnitrophica bacterium]|nr:2-isopropylmalate synthase [Candidatus Omnitrophota bacterium]